MEVLIGVDPHKATNAMAALNEHGELLEHANFPTNRAGLRLLKRWAKRCPERRWAVESASGMGRSLAQHLVTDGERVVWTFPPSYPLASECSLRATGARTTP
jgi:hypothetical protein